LKAGGAAETIPDQSERLDSDLREAVKVLPREGNKVISASIKNLYGIDIKCV